MSKEIRDIIASTNYLLFAVWSLIYYNKLELLAFLFFCEKKKSFSAESFEPKKDKPFEKQNFYIHRILHFWL